jgi:hypothetical protein
MRAEVEKLAQRGAVKCTALIDGGKLTFPMTQHRSTVHNAQPGAVAHHEAPDALALVAWLHKDALLKKLDAEIDAVADDKNAMSVAAREQAEADIAEDLLETERLESLLVWRAQNEGLPVEHRSDADVRSILGVALIAAARADAMPGTSALHGISFAGGGMMR